jgi:multiple sugar transport system permease protein
MRLRKRLFNPSAHADGTDSSASDRTLAYLLLAPTIAVLLSLTIYPLIYSIKISLQGESGNWTLANFTRLAGDQFFLSSLAHTFVYAAVALTLEFLIGLGLALLLDTQIRGRGLFRALLLLPMMLPPVVVGVVWRLMLNSNFGAVNGTLKRIGVNTEALAWTASPKLAMASVIAADVWQWTPFMFLILLAGLQAIPQEPYEAALIDGSSRWQTFLHVTFASAETGNSDRAAVADDGPPTRVRSDIYPDRRWARVCDRDCQSLHLSHSVSLFQFRLRRRDVVCAAGDYQRDQRGIHPAIANTCVRSPTVREGRSCFRCVRVTAALGC